MGVIDDPIVLEHIVELKTIVGSTNGKLPKSKISPQDYFINLSHEAPSLIYPEVGISRVVVNICELISTLLLEDIDESNSISKVIVMAFEYYFLVAPILFKDQGARFVNDIIFMKHFMHYIKSLCNSRPQAQKELGNTLAALDLMNPIKDIEC